MKNNILKLAALSLVAIFATGCATGAKRVDANYAAQLESIERQKNAELQFNTLKAQADANSAKACEQDTNPGLCVVALRLASNAGTASSTQQMQVPTYRPTYHPAWNIAGNVIDKVAGIGLPAYFGYKNNKVTSEMWTNIVDGIASRPTYNVGGNLAMGDMTTVGGNLGDTDNSDHSVTVGQDYIIGNENITGDGNIVGDGNTYVSGSDNLVGDNNNTGDGNTIGDGNIGRDQVNGDQFNGRDQINGNGNFNEGRQGSPGPYNGVQPEELCNPAVQQC